MGVRILDGIYDGSRTAAALVDSTTDTAFGPLFKNAACAEDFLAWLPAHVVTDGDPRKLDAGQLEHMHAKWVKERLDADGDLVE